MSGFNAGFSFGVALNKSMTQGIGLGNTNPQALAHIGRSITPPQVAGSEDAYIEQNLEVGQDATIDGNLTSGPITGQIASGQTDNPLQIKNSSGGVIAKIDINGVLTTSDGSLGSAAYVDSDAFDAAGDAEAAQAAAIAAAASTALQATNNLGDLTNVSAAQGNMGLGSAATHAATDFVASSTLGQASGTAQLDSTGHLTSAQIPTSLTNALSLLGTWNASTNTPSLASGVGTSNTYYVVSVSGTTTLDGISVWAAGDWAVFVGSAWTKVEGSSNVSSFNGRTGAIVPGSSDYTASMVNALPSTTAISCISPLVASGSLGGNNLILSIIPSLISFSESQVISLTSDLASKLPSSTSLIAGAGISVIGNLGSGCSVINLNPTAGLASTTAISLVAPLSSTGSLAANNLTLSMAAATNSIAGYLTSADHTIFNSKITQSDIYIYRAGNLVNTYTSDGTDAGRGSTLLTVLASDVSAGDLVLLAPGTYNVGGYLNSTGYMTFPANITIRGAGMYLTTILSTYDQSHGGDDYANFLLQDGTVIEELTLKGNSYDNSTTFFQDLISGVYTSGSSITATMRKVQWLGDSDGIYMGSFAHAFTLYLYDCIGHTHWDCVASLGSSNNPQHVEAWRTTFITTQPSHTYNPGLSATNHFSNCCNMQTGTLIAHQCQFIATGDSNSLYTFGIATNAVLESGSNGSGATITLDGCTFNVTSSHGTVYDIDASNSLSTYYLHDNIGTGTANSPTINGSSATINYVYGFPVAGLASGLPTSTASTLGLLAAADFTRFDTRITEFQLFGPTTNCATGTGLMYFVCTETLNGRKVSAANAFTVTAGVTGTMSIQLVRIRSGVSNNIFSTTVNIASGANADDQAYVINSSYSGLATGDVLRVDVSSVQSGTPAQGLVFAIETS